LVPDRREEKRVLCSFRLRIEIKGKSIHAGQCSKLKKAIVTSPNGGRAIPAKGHNNYLSEKTLYVCECLWIVEPVSRLSSMSSYKKSESQEEGGGPGFRGIGFIETNSLAITIWHLSGFEAIRYRL
jgi:hypothetical protein